MEPNETMVENENLDIPADDELPESVEEETDESAESLDSLTAEEQAAPEPQPEQQATEPGWIKQRVNKAVEKALAEQERRLTAQFEAQMAPIRDKMLTDEAKELVRQGEFKSLDRAKEYLQLKQGVPVSQPAEQNQPRNAQGQFAPKQEQQNDDPVITARIDLLAHQADTIKARTGVDVMAEFNSNEEVKQKIINGEMDFYDVAEMLKTQPKPKKPPAPMRSPNGASGHSPNAIETMTAEQFARMEKRIQEGARYSLR